MTRVAMPIPVPFAVALLLVADPPAAGSPQPVRDEIKGTALAIELVPVTPADGSPPFLLTRTEITWDIYDTLIFGFDREAGQSTPEADAVTRPTKPYVATDRGFGHAGFPAISVSFRGAQACAEWLTAKTGKKYRVPTLKEWKAACAAARIPVDAVGDHAVFAGNSVVDGEMRTRAVGSRKPDALGCFDLWGNAAEWCVGDDGKPVLLGGSYRDPPEKVGCDASLASTPDWNASDPQYPKSIWWLTDAPFAGFRLVREP
jgi:formylglycine-generating enzyme required for sulfatase activity